MQVPIGEARTAAARAVGEARRFFGQKEPASKPCAIPAGDK